MSITKKKEEDFKNRTLDINKIHRNICRVPIDMKCKFISSHDYEMLHAKVSGGSCVLLCSIDIREEIDAVEKDRVGYFIDYCYGDEHTALVFLGYNYIRAKYLFYDEVLNPHCLTDFYREWKKENGK